jgi:hypothetical protein
MHKDAGEHRVLDDVGGTAGVKGVAIVHSRVPRMVGARDLRTG